MVVKKRAKGVQRLPDGYSRVRPDVGAVLRSRREEEDLTQQDLVDLVGIARESLLRIERGRVCPRFDTLLRLMAVLELEERDVLELKQLAGPEASATKHVQSATNYDLLDDRRAGLGINLRQGRRAADLTLRQLATRCGMSAAQLSRIERGQACRSRVLENDLSYAGVSDDRRGVHFKNGELQRLADLGARS